MERGDVAGAVETNDAHLADSSSASISGAPASRSGSRRCLASRNAMFIDFAALSEHQRYKLMASLIVPRPIALVTTLGADGVVNAAPFSMFNMMGEEPPIVMISVNRLHDGPQKDTAANIARSREFVVHLADEAIAQQMHDCGERLPPPISEVAQGGIHDVAPSRFVTPPRIADAPVAFECSLWETLETASRQIFIGRVLALHCPRRARRHRQLARSPAGVLSRRALRGKLLRTHARPLLDGAVGRGRHDHRRNLIRRRSVTRAAGAPFALPSQARDRASDTIGRNGAISRLQRTRNQRVARSNLRRIVDPRAQGPAARARAARACTRGRPIRRTSSRK